jgi:hypothetical protein
MAIKLEPDRKPSPNEKAVARWLQEIADAEVREKDYRKEGARCVKIYEAQDAADRREPFPILYSNTETMLPALYNSRPIPYAKRRFDDPDPVGKLAGEIVTRSLRYLIEAEDERYDNFDDLMGSAVLQTLLVNRGITRFRYVADFANIGGEEEVAHECVYGEEVAWDDFLHGYARTWKKVPWIAFRHRITQEEAKRLFPDTWKNIQFSDAQQTSDRNADTTSGDSSNLKGVKLAVVYEIWDKATKKVYWVCPGCKDDWVKAPVDDPLKCSGFFPIPKPLNLFRKVSTLTPTPLYAQYESQARELNKITNRLTKLIEACKIRGFYNSTIEGIDKLLKADDNDLIPLENMQSMPDGTGIDKMIWLMPLAEIVQAVQTLYQQREQCKQVIYEITGVSDILRGASVASETATAQNIKNQWGTLRLKKMQKEVQRYCRDALRIMAEIAVQHLSKETLAQMTSVQAPTAEEKQQLAMQREQLMAQAQTMGPEAAQQAQQLPDPAAVPSWDEAMQLLQNELTRSYRVDIETNSTIDAEASQDKQDISELLNALSQFLNGIAPLVQNGTMPFELAKQMMLTISRRYNFGSKIEEYLEKMAPPQQGPDPEKQAEMELAKQQHEFDMQAKQVDLQIKQQEAKMAADQAAMELQMRREELAMEMEFKRQEHQLKLQELQAKAVDMQRKAQLSERQHQQKMQMAATKPEKEKVDA